MDHEDDVMTYDAWLQEVDVKAGDKVKQVEDLGDAGNNLFGKDDGTHVHFEIRKHGKEVDPESYFDQQVSKMDEEAAEETTEEETEDEVTDEENKEESSESEENKEISTEEGNEEKDNEKKSSEDEREGLSDDPSQNEDHESDRSDVNQDEQLTPNKDDLPFDR